MSRRPLALSLFALALTLAPAPPLLAEDAPAPWLTAEREALRLEGRLDYDGAFERTRAALAGALAAKAWDAATVHALKLDFLSRQLARPDRLVQALEGIEAPPLLHARVAWLLREAHLRAGDRARAETAAKGLGLIGHYLIVGPFDNERGRGFSTAYGPEAPGPVDAAQGYEGKSRPVSWRPAEADLGLLDLDAHLRPNDEAIAYALAFIHHEGPPREAALRVASDEGLIAFWNDREVLRRDVDRPVTFDQDAALVRLETGWNKLVCKVAEKKGPWGLVCRLTTPQGGALAVRVADGVELASGLAPAEATGDAPDPALEDGPLAMAASRAAREGASAEDLFRLGYLHYRIHAHDRSERPEREAYRKAAALAPGDAAVRLHLALVLSEAGELDVSREENPRRRMLEEALAKDPESARAGYLLAEHALDVLRSVDLAWERLAPFADAGLEPALLEAELLRRRGLDGPAQARLLSLASSADGSHPFIMRRAARVLPIARRTRMLEAALAREALDTGLRQDLIETLRTQGRLDEERAVIEAWTTLEPQSRDAWEARSRSALGRGDLAEAKAALDAALAIAAEDEDLLESLGRLHRRAGRKGEAIAAFEEVLRVQPGNVSVSRYLELLRESEVPFEAAWREDPGAVWERARAVVASPEVPLRVLLDQDVIRVSKDGTSSRYHQSIQRIENEDGVRALSAISVPYAHGEQQVTFKEALVIRPDGRRIVVPVGSTRGGRAGGGYAQYRSASVPLPALEVGDTVAFAYRLDDIAVSFFGDYFGHTHVFQSGPPVERSRFVLIAPRAKPLFFHVKNAEAPPETEERTDGDDLVRVFAMGPLPRREPEAHMPAPRELAPAVEVSSFKDWDAFTTWYWNLVKKQREVSPALRAKVLELVKGRETREEKIRAIYGFVVSEVRYNDKWEFGVHGFKPYNASSIFERRFGDCKDKATLINTMLDVLGIESWPVLIRGEARRSKEDFALPLMTHFNHCIAYVPGKAPDGGDGWFLDGTAQHHPAHILPSMDYGAEVLIVTPKGGELKRIGFPEPLTENGIEERSTVRLRRDGTALIEAEILPRGVPEVVLRDALVNEAERKERIERLYGRALPGAKVVSLETEGLDDLERPVRIRVKLDVPRLLESDGGPSRLLEPKSVLLEALLGDKLSGLAPQEERKTDVVLPIPIGGREVIEVELPEGAEVRSLPAPVELDTPQGRYIRRYERKGGTLRITRELELKVPRIEKERYDAWRRFVTEVDRAEEESARLRMKGAEQ